MNTVQYVAVSGSVVACDASGPRRGLASPAVPECDGFYGLCWVRAEKVLFGLLADSVYQVSVWEGKLNGESLRVYSVRYPSENMNRTSKVFFLTTTDNPHAIRARRLLEALAASCDSPPAGQASMRHATATLATRNRRDRPKLPSASYRASSSPPILGLVRTRPGRWVWR